MDGEMADMNYFMTGVMLTFFGNLIACKGTFLQVPVPLWVALVMQFIGVAYVLDFYLSLKNGRSVK
jgi:hypothetical protein